MESEDYDVIVVGAGIIGSFTAYHLLKNGAKKVLLLEQFHAGHTRGSSHGGSRLSIKSCFSPVPFELKLLTRSEELYSELQKQSTAKLFIPTTMMTCALKTNSVLGHMSSYLKSEGHTKPLLSANEVQEQFKSQLNFPDDFNAVFEPNRMFVLPRLLSRLHELFVSGGGVFLDGYCVSEVIPGERVTVTTNKGTFTAPTLILTLGPWAPQHLEKLGTHIPVKILKAETLYWKVSDSKLFTPDVFPPQEYLDLGDDIDMIVFPEMEYPGLIKVYHRTHQPIVPDHRDAGGPGPQSVEKVSQFIKTFMKGVSTTPAIYEPCIYSETVDRIPIIDTIPGHQNILYGAGLSGRGVMWGPAIGELLAQLALNIPTTVSPGPFRLASRKKAKL